MAGVTHPLWRTARAPVLVMLVCALACLSATTSGAQAAAPPPISAMNAFAASGLAPAQLDPQLAAMHSHGVTMVRSDAAWANIEPQPPGPSGHDWQWSSTDAWVAQLASYHLAWEPIIDYSVWWAKNCPGFCVPASDITYATFAQAVAARYGAGGTFWAENPQLPYHPARIFEIWNEPNVTTFWIAPALYGPLYGAARTAIHAVDQQATVIIGGMAEDSGVFSAGQDGVERYLDAVFAADPALKGQVDGVGLHPYGAAATDVEGWVKDIRKDLITEGEASVPLYLTEFGWQTGDSSAESWRAEQMSTLALTLSRSNCGIAMLAPYDWINPLSANESGDFGLVDRTAQDTTLRPAGTAWFSGLAQASRLPQLALCPGGPSTGPTSATGSTGSTGRGGSSGVSGSTGSQRRRHRRRDTRKHRRHDTARRHRHRS